MIPWSDIGVIDVEGSAERNGFYRQVNQARLINPNAFKVIRIPGGNSVEILRNMRKLELDKAVQGFAAAGGIVWGVCAGCIIMASEVEDGPETKDPWEGGQLGLLDCKVRRFWWGDTDFEDVVNLSTPEGQCRMPFTFIQAPAMMSATEPTKIIGYKQQLDGGKAGGMVAVNGKCFGWCGSPTGYSDGNWLFNLCAGGSDAG